VILLVKNEKLLFSYIIKQKNKTYAIKSNFTILFQNIFIDHEHWNYFS